MKTFWAYRWNSWQYPSPARTPWNWGNYCRQCQRSSKYGWRSFQHSLQGILRQSGWKEGPTLRIKSFYQIPQLSPRQFAIRALVPKKVFPHDIPGLGLNLQKHWRILIDTQYAINLDIFGAWHQMQILLKYSLIGLTWTCETIGESPPQRNQFSRGKSQGLRASCSRRAAESDTSAEEYSILLVFSSFFYFRYLFLKSYIF